MKHFSSHRGSALLVVLGMLSFMVISAVGFATYMRSARLPSSYLRRNVVARQLAKAALAEAMEFIDFTIGNNPGPGVGTKTSTSSVRATALGLSTGEKYNYWYHNIFIGTNGWMDVQLGEKPPTISTLTLEGLAYIPPPLVNEARRYSRRSIGGQWRNLSFDAGRYAFCAIDVSNCFDVNRVQANTRRDSGANRVSLAHLFENSDHTGYNTGFTPQKWDDFMQQYGNLRKPTASTPGMVQDNKVPFISIADINLAMYAAYGQSSPFTFARYVSGDYQNGFYCTQSQFTSEAEAIKNLQFVTDSFFPPVPESVYLDQINEALDELGESSITEIYDLNSSDGQFFSNIDDDDAPNDVSYKEVRDMSSTVINAVNSRRKLLSKLDLCCLYDYLDGDSVPVSLAIPCVERVPSVIGIEQKLKPQMTLECEDSGWQDKGGSDTEKEYEKTLTGKMNKFAQTLRMTTLKVQTVFPFLRAAPSGFNVDACIRLWFSSSPTLDKLRGYTYIRPTDKNAFTTTEYKDGIINLACDRAATISGTTPTDAESAIQTVSLNFASASSIDVFDHAFTVKLKKVVPVDDDGNEDENSAKVTVETDGTIANFVPLKSDESGMDENYSDQSKFVTLMGKAIEEVTDPAGVTEVDDMYLHAAVFVRITDQDGKVVDMVPATLADDGYQNSAPGLSGAAAKVLGTLLGTDGALMHYSASSTATGVSVKFSPAGFSGDWQPTLEPSVLYCADPRFNYAPEDWYIPNGTSSLSKDSWLSTCGAPTLGSNDYDIFFGVSNCGYLQSVYELAYLPRLSPKFVYENKDLGILKNISLDDSKRSFVSSEADTQFSQTTPKVNWSTYSPFDKGSSAADQRDNFEKLGIVSLPSGFRVSAASTSVDNFMAAVANTPISWELAGTNANNVAGGEKGMEVETFNRQYAFNAMNNSALISWDKLNDVAAELQSAMTSSTDSSNSSKKEETEDETPNVDLAFSDLTWYDSSNPNSLFGVDLGSNSSSGSTKIHDIDRKMLYGFWHDSFTSVGQQLFLIFVRAEPMMMGGGSVGQTPPQLGSKAVALVWRDPTKSQNDDTPHRMRILFYRQFD